jgi:hypothetical protein
VRLFRYAAIGWCSCALLDNIAANRPWYAVSMVVCIAIHVVIDLLETRK